MQKANKRASVHRFSSLPLAYPPQSPPHISHQHYNSSTLRGVLPKFTFVLKSERRVLLLLIINSVRRPSFISQASFSHGVRVSYELIVILSYNEYVPSDGLIDIG